MEQQSHCAALASACCTKFQSVLAWLQRKPKDIEEVNQVFKVRLDRFFQCLFLGLKYTPSPTLFACEIESITVFALPFIYPCGKHERVATTRIPCYIAGSNMHGIGALKDAKETLCPNRREGRIYSTSGGVVGVD